MSTPYVVVSCEHGGHEVPRPLARLFLGAHHVLESHRGWDAGALGLAQAMAARLDAPLHSSRLTRLVVDRNRSPGHPRVFSEFTRDLPPDQRARLLALWHTPYREEVDALVAGLLAAGGAVDHLGVHSFTPVLDGKVRTADVALLYDPARTAEKRLAAAWTAELRTRLPGLAIRRNQPYRGASDGLTTWLRRHGPAYRGIEVEINQRLLDRRGSVPARVADALVEGYRAAAGRSPTDPDA